MRKVFAFILSLVMAASLAACAQPDVSTDGPNAGLANPLTECSSLEEVNAAVGGNLQAPGVMGVTDEKYFTIDCGEYKIAEYDYSVNGAGYSFRFCPVFDIDASGIYIDAQPAFSCEPSDAPEYAADDSVQAARWVDVNGQYVLSTHNIEMDKDTFLGIAAEMRSLTAGGKAEADYAALEGEYQDSFSMRAVATVAANNGDSVNISVSWSSSAFEHTVWVMNASYAEDGLLSYSDCVKSNITTAENSEETVAVEYENGSGYFEVADGKLLWTGADEESCVQCIFEKVQ